MCVSEKERECGNVTRLLHPHQCLCRSVCFGPGQPLHNLCLYQSIITHNRHTSRGGNCGTFKTSSLSFYAWSVKLTLSLHSSIRTKYMSDKTSLRKYISQRFTVRGSNTSSLEQCSVVQCSWSSFFSTGKQETILSQRRKSEPHILSTQVFVE